MDTYTKNNVTLYCGDAFDILPSLPSESVDHVISDLPYGNTSCSWDTAPDLTMFWDHSHRLTKQHPNFVLFSCGFFSIDLINSNRKGYRYDLIWYKNTCTGFLNCNLMPLRNHEQIMLFGKEQKTKAVYNPQTTPKKARVCRRVERNKIDTVYKDVGVIEGKTYTETQPSSVLYFPKEYGAAHSTTKPLSLMMFLVN